MGGPQREEFVLRVHAEGYDVIVSGPFQFFELLFYDSLVSLKEAADPFRAVPDEESLCRVECRSCNVRGLPACAIAIRDDSLCLYNLAQIAGRRSPTLQSCSSEGESA